MEEQTTRPEPAQNGEGSARTTTPFTTTPFGSVHVETKPGELAPSTVVAIDDRQDEIMTATPVDGRPPTHAHRVEGWRLIALALSLVVLGGAAWAAMTGVSAATVVAFVIMFAVLLTVGGAPVILAGVSRGKQEAAARAQATAEIAPGLQAGLRHETKTPNAAPTSDAVHPA